MWPRLISASTSSRKSMTRWPPMLERASPWIFKISFTEESGIAKVESATSTSTAEMIAMVRGRVIVTVVPARGEERTRRLPFISSTAYFTASIPTPRPEISDTRSAVLNPGRNMNPRIRCVLAVRASSLPINPFSTAFFRTALRSSPRPSSETSMQIWSPSW